MVAEADGSDARSTLRLGLACGPDGLTFVLVWTFDTLPLALRTWVGACHRREEANRSKRERGKTTDFDWRKLEKRNLECECFQHGTMVCVCFGGMRMSFGRRSFYLFGRAVLKTKEKKPWLIVQQRQISCSQGVEMKRSGDKQSHS